MRIDTILTNLTAITLDEVRPRAHRIGLHHGRIVALDEDLDGLRAVRTVDLGGACVVPGFNDAHNHMALYGMAQAELDLSSPNVRTLDDLYTAVAERARELPAGSWLTGSGYDQNKLGGHPHREVLDRIAPDHKVWLKHTSAHMCVVNSAVLKEIDRTVPAGGRVVTGADGQPTGLIEEQAQQLVRDLVYPYSTAQLADAIARASRDYLREGLTSCTEAGIGLGWIGHSPVEAAAYQQARDEGRLGVRVRLMVTTDTLHPLRHHPDDPGGTGLDLGLRTGFGDEWLQLGAVKVFSDGSLIGRTAAMCCDFAGEAGNRGYLQADEEELRERIAAAHAAGWQVATHAIGDRAIDLVLDAYEQAALRFPRAGTRHRIEHCGVTRPDQLARLAALGVVPVPQAAFVGRLGDGMRAALGPDREAWCYRHRSFLDVGLTVPGSSDRPIVPGAPLRGIHDMVNRRTETGGLLGPQESVTALEALRAYTLGSAYAGFEEHLKGSIRPGKLADLAVLDTDPTATAPERIADTAVLATLVGGRFAFDGRQFTRSG
ncbi:amidohydrolase [Streptomyces sp. A3M-1-3]|uniref:amidohydrolase n=1 Tax=Streptomyces sp. A3M-1-3 TaxID=2962044 RepID=UPI0020B7BB2E|nr:amidohydrolase [Streptomyces sp. A3M-1-3]MCP3818169.1 amidohydrolase [Streptomyces sp. A3M-1-3]